MITLTLRRTLWISLEEKKMQAIDVRTYAKERCIIVNEARVTVTGLVGTLDFPKAEGEIQRKRKT